MNVSSVLLNICNFFLTEGFSPEPEETETGLTPLPRQEFINGKYHKYFIST